MVQQIPVTGARTRGAKTTATRPQRSEDGEPARSALGTITKTRAAGVQPSSGAIKIIAESSQVEAIDPETGEVKTFVQSGTGFKLAGNGPEALRQARYALHHQIREVDPDHRSASCLWAVCDSSKSVQVSLDNEFQRARFNNLRVCGRVWTCPFCSAKISERRALELASAIEVGKAKSIKVALLTCTVPHVRQEALKDLTNGLMKAWTRFVSNRRGKVIREYLGLVGTIRNIEVTRGDNGWHPHFHCLVFFKSEHEGERLDEFLQMIEKLWSEHWQDSTVKVGLRRPSDEHGLTLQNGDYAASYVSKWGLEHELTKSMAKLGRKSGRTPFDLLRDRIDGLEPTVNASLWREFSKAFHQVRQLFWSKGLKKLLQVSDVSDEELVAQEEERPTTLVCELNMVQWRAVRRQHRATLLTLAEKNPEAIPDFLDRLTSKLNHPVAQLKQDLRCDQGDQLRPDFLVVPSPSLTPKPLPAFVMPNTSSWLKGDDLKRWIMASPDACAQLDLPLKRKLFKVFGC